MVLQLNPTSPRFETWRYIFGCDRISVIGSSTMTYDFFDGNYPAYALDMASLTATQIRRLLEVLQQTTGCSTFAILDQIMQRGFPIRSADTQPDELFVLPTPTLRRIH